VPLHPDNMIAFSVIFVLFCCWARAAADLPQLETCRVGTDTVTLRRDRFDSMFDFADSEDEAEEFDDYDECDEEAGAEEGEILLPDEPLTTADLRSSARRKVR